MNLYDYQWQNRNPDTHMEYRPEEISRPGDHDIDNSHDYTPKRYKPITLHLTSKKKK